MSAELFAIILGVTIFFIIMSFDKEEKTLDQNMGKRLNDIKNKVYIPVNPSEDEHQKIQDNMKMLIQDSEYKILVLGNLLSKIEVTKKIKHLLKIADIKMTVDIFFMISFGLAAPFLLLAMAMPKKAIAFIIIGIILAYVPFLLVRMKIKKRHGQFTQQLPDTLGLISSSLRAGHSLLSSFQMVVQEMPEPINQLFKVVVDDVSLGRDTRDALDNMTSYMPDSVDLRFFVTAVLIQREIGGNLAEILDNLNHTIRERFKLIGQLESQTAQAKMSGIVLALAPAVIGMIIYVMNPTYMEPLFKTTMGQCALGASVVMAIVGFLVIKQITTIKI